MLCKFRNQFVWLVSLIISVFSLKYTKQQTSIITKTPIHKSNIIVRSSSLPTVSPADHPLLLLEDSEIESSPGKLSFTGSLSTTGFVNSTPLTHMAGFRKTRRDHSVNSLFG